MDLPMYLQFYMALVYLKLFVAGIAGRKPGKGHRKLSQQHWDCVDWSTSLGSISSHSGRRAEQLHKHSWGVRRPAWEAASAEQNHAWHGTFPPWVPHRARLSGPGIPAACCVLGFIGTAPKSQRERLRPGPLASIGQRSCKGAWGCCCIGRASHIEAAWFPQVQGWIANVALKDSSDPCIWLSTSDQLGLSPAGGSRWTQPINEQFANWKMAQSKQWI